jgi:hypothetical protein
MRVRAHGESAQRRFGPVKASLKPLPAGWYASPGTGEYR